MKFAHPPCTDHRGREGAAQPRGPEGNDDHIDDSPAVVSALLELPERHDPRARYAWHTLRLQCSVIAFDSA